MEEKEETVFCSIGEVARLTGFSERQIRYYEKKGLVSPRRTPGGQRIYSPQDVKRIRTIKRLREEGYSLQRIARLLRPEEVEKREVIRYPLEALEEDPKRQLQGEPLRSLYPVSDYARLMKILESLEEEEFPEGG
jgi:DNA-binding transcriptional MerR regulator